MKRKELISKVIFIIAVILFVMGIMQVKGIASSVEHTHIWASKYDSTNHWEYCTVCNQRRNVIAHTYTDHWHDGRENCADYSNRTCDCGYSYIYRIPHKEDTTKICYSDGWYHFTKCSVCGNWLSTEECKKEDGSKITCTNLGTCVTCEHTYASARHIVKKNR